MKRFYLILTVALCSALFTACEYDDNDLWNKVDSLEQQVQTNANDIATLTALIEAMESKKFISSVQQLESGYVLTLSDGTKVEINNESLFKSVVVYGDEIVITLNDGRTITLPVAGMELRYLTFEDEDAAFDSYTLDYADVQIDTWSDLIDNAQYGGKLLYNDFATVNYAWYDENNTLLSSRCDGPYWNGGMAVSNYVIEDYMGQPNPEDEEAEWYKYQLATPIGGNGDSENFCVANMTSFSFGDGGEYVIDHMYVTNTSYVINSLLVGDEFAAPASDVSWMKLVATGYDADGNKRGEVELLLCDGKANVLTEWTRMELKSLGEVAKVEFSYRASDDLCGSWGINTPCYFAFDDVAVWMEEK